MMISDTDKAWFAAVLDMKARWVRRHNTQRAPGSEQITLYVDSSVTEITAKMAAMTGTNPEPHNQPGMPQQWLSRGCAEHCPEAHVHNYRDPVMPPSVKWSVTGASAAIILWNLRRYMVSQREPWDWIMGTCFASTRLSGKGAKAATDAIKRMHSLGWDLPPLFRDVIPKEIMAPVKEEEVGA